MAMESTQEAIQDFALWSAYSRAIERRAHLYCLQEEEEGAADHY